MFDFDCLLKHLRSVTGENLSFETVTDSLRNECHVVKFGNAIKNHWYNESLYEIKTNKPSFAFNNNICNNQIMSCRTIIKT